jgi:hypothetical protein
MLKRGEHMPMRNTYEVMPTGAPKRTALHLYVSLRYRLADGPSDNWADEPCEPPDRVEPVK